MYNEQLDNLIELALTDGVLTEKEKQVLFKKAESMGVDLDEFEMVLEAKLFEKKKQTQKVTASPKSDKLGDIKKCPACGAITESFATRCRDCGTEFRNTGANNSVKELSKGLDRVVTECEAKSYKHMVGRGYGNEETARLDDIVAKQKYVIKNFPVPNTREDILELLYFIQPKIEIGFRADKNVFDWRNKYKEIINRAKSSYHSENRMLDELSKLENELHQSSPFGYIFCLYSTSSAMFKWVLSMIGFMGLLGIIYLLTLIF